MKSKTIALSAISSAFIAIILTLGAYIEIIDLMSVIVSALFSTLPLYYKSKKGAILSVLVGGVLAFILSGANIFTLVFPAYFLFFGIYPVINEVVSESKMDKNLWKVLSLIWCVAVCYFLLFYYAVIMQVPIYDFELFGKTFNLSNLKNIRLYFLTAWGGVSVLLYFVYNKFISVMFLASKNLLKRILK